MKRKILASLLAASAIALTGCSTSSGSTGGDGGSATAPGVTDTEIQLGMTVALTGPYADFGVEAKGAEAYFDYVNDQGGVNGRKINLTVRDDQFDPSKTVPLTQQLVNETKVFAMFAGSGTATNAATYKQLSSQKVPDVMIGSGSSTFSKPVVPYVNTLLPSYQTEAKILADYIEKTYPGKKVGLVTLDGDAGDDYRSVMLPILGKDVVDSELFEATDTSLSSQITRVKEKGAQVVFMFGQPTLEALALQAARSMDWNVPFIAGGPSDDIRGIASKADLEGLTLITGFKPASDTSDPAVAQAKQLLAKYEAGAPVNSSSIEGVAAAQIVVAALKKAGKDLTRESFMKAFDSLTIGSGVWYGNVDMTATSPVAVQCEQFYTVHNGLPVDKGQPVCPAS